MARICILGGTGFVGQVLAGRLAARGHQIRIPSRRRFRHRGLLVLPGLDLVQADIHDKRMLARCTEGMDAVINLVGILNESRARRQTFRTAHMALAKTLGSLCHAQHIPRLLQMSALGADRNARSQYLSSKAEAEASLFLMAGTTAVTSFRPSVIFGPGDHFVTGFARLLRRVPCCFPLACPDSRFAPVYVGDVAERMCDSLDDWSTHGQAVPLCGPDVYAFRELVELIADMAGLRRKVIGLPPRLSRLQAHVLGHLPGRAFTMDNYHSLQVGSVCDDDATPCPTHLEPVMRAALAPR